MGLAQRLELLKDGKRGEKRWGKVMIYLDYFLAINKVRVYRYQSLPHDEANY